MIEFGRYVEFLFGGGSPEHATDNFGLLRIERRTVGTLRLPSGRLAAWDPLWTLRNLGAEELVCAEVAPGDYSFDVSLAVQARKETKPDTFVAAARVLLSSEPTVDWKPSRGTVANPRGFDVDSGLGAFFDLAAIPVIDRQKEKDDLDGAIDVLLRRPEGSLFIEGRPGEGNVAVYICGMGDGVYPVWLGRSADGAIAQVVADLEFVELDQLGPVGV